MHLPGPGDLLVRGRCRRDVAADAAVEGERVLLPPSHREPGAESAAGGVGEPLGCDTAAPFEGWG